MKITVTTPSGNVGRKVASNLLDRDAEVVLYARRPEKVSDLTSRGARIVQGDQGNAQALSEATKGADALFWVNPTDYTTMDAMADTRRFAGAATEAIRQNATMRVVMISSIGGQLTSGTGPIVSLHETEQILKRATENLTILRPNYFMENVLTNLPMIISDGAMYSIEPGELSFHQVATKDIAAVAVDTLLPGEPGTRIIDILGPEKISHNRIAEIVSRLIGKPVQHVVVPPEALKGGLVAAGISDHVANLFLEMSEASIKGLLDQCVGDELRQGTTTLQEFAEETFLPAYLAETGQQAKRA